MENSTELAERLKREGRWGEFQKRRVELEAAGASKKDAHAEAALEFQPIGAPDVAGQPMPPPVTLGIVYRESTNFRDTIQWVFDNMDVENVNYAGCPSSGAFSMLRMCRSNAQMKFEFYKSIMPRLLPSKAEIDAGEGQKDSSRRALTIIDRVAQFSREAKGEERTGEEKRTEQTGQKAADAASGKAAARAVPDETCVPERNVGPSGHGSGAGLPLPELCNGVASPLVGGREDEGDF